MDIFSMVAALVAAFGVVMAKVITTVRMSQLERTISSVEHQKQTILGNLKAVSSQKKVFNANRAILERKKTKLAGRKSRLEKELGTFDQEDERRSLQREQTRGKLIR
ncbi:MAG: hypothetical protein HN712_16070 [Gemmatimonadetes bacterium]|jgi:hypothetical protein|nr:hypothetical protein [Gemmatimonadota bacterium]MBT6147327.1 hypothetical protein [Gemmatimonadota bacterium]MBT7861832.1 hypothetical protein [Gemmatimonadota bacterium]